MQDHAIPCNTMQDHAIPCKTMQYHAIPCTTMQYHAIPCITMQYHASQCNTMQFHAISCNTMRHYKCCRSVPVPCGQYKAIFSSVRSSNSHPDLLVTHHPLFQITPVLNTRSKLSEPLQLYQRQSLDSFAGYMYTLWVQQDITAR